MEQFYEQSISNIRFVVEKNTVKVDIKYIFTTTLLYQFNRFHL